MYVQYSVVDMMKTKKDIGKKDDKLKSFLQERKESGDYCAKVH